MKVNAISKDININILRERSNLLSLNLSWESLTYSNLSFIPYIDRMKAQNNNPS